MLFNELGLPIEILQAVSDMGYKEATPIQAQAIPAMLGGSDIVGRSNTGTGKTAAFAIPAVMSVRQDIKGVQILVLCPTRELAMQACGEFEKFSAYMPGVRPCAVYGGASMEKQLRDLKRGANIVVGTPGRIMDHMRRGSLRLDLVKLVVLDEADVMLDMGFREDIEEILGNVPDGRQTALFSATMPPPIMALTEKYLKEPVVVKVESAARTVDSIEQKYFEVPMGRKTDALRMLLTAYEPSLAMVFCNTKKMVDELTEALVSFGFKAAGLHGDMKQSSRTQVLDAFKAGKINVLIATDVAARGIDVENVDAVFNYDLPQDNEYYIHRIGRTGRAGKSGAAYTIISGRRQYYELRDISKFIKTEIIRSRLPDRESIVAARIGQIAERTAQAAGSGKYSQYAGVIDELCEKGFTARDIAAALIGQEISENTKNIPEISAAPYENRSDRRRGDKTVRVEISAGRADKLAPNFVLGALVDATGLPGKSFGKIDIYDRFTTVEVPEEDKEHILDSMNGTRINGHRVTVRTYEGRGERLEGSRRRTGRPGRKNALAKGSRPRYENRRKG